MLVNNEQSVRSTCDAKVSSQITSQNAQLRAPLSPYKQPGLVSILICIVVGNPQQTPLWWKIATAHHFGSGGVADIVLVQAVCWERVELIIEHSGK